MGLGPGSHAGRENTPGHSGALSFVVAEPHDRSLVADGRSGDFPMMRKCLLGIKRRAEALTLTDGSHSPNAAAH